MPCYTVNVMDIELKMKSKDLIVSVLKDLKIIFKDLESKIIIMGKPSIILDLERGKAEIPETRIDFWNMLKRKYSEKVVKTVAEKRKWALKQEGNKLQLSKY